VKLFTKWLITCIYKTFRKITTDEFLFDTKLLIMFSAGQLTIVTGSLSQWAEPNSESDRFINKSFSSILQTGSND